MRKLLSLAVFVAALSTGGRAEAATRGKLWLVIDQASENSLHCSSMLEDFYACLLNATNFDDTIAKYTGSTLRAVSPLDFGGMFIASTGSCGNPGSAGWNPMLQCVVNAAKLDKVVDGDYILYIPPPGGFYAVNCTLCNVTSGGKNVSIRAGFTQSGKCDGYTFGSIHETFEANTYGGSDDCCNGYYASGVSEDASCINLYSSTGGELSVSCGYRSYQMQRITNGPRSNGTFYGTDCFPVKVTAAAGSPQSVCELPNAQRHAGKCIGGNAVTCPLMVSTTTCADGCFEDTTGAHCAAFGATCTVQVPPSTCSGGKANVVVSCKNTGTATWAATLALQTMDGQPSSIADATWPSPAHAAVVSPTSVGPGATGTFTFVADMPAVTKTTSVLQRFVLGSNAAPEVDVSVLVNPCNGTDGGDAGTTPVPEDNGCACNATGSSKASAAGWFVFAFAVLRARRRRRA